MGGLGAYLFHGSLESLFVGWGAGVWLALCSLAMSDMRHEWVGPLGVKMAWGESCAVCRLRALRLLQQCWLNSAHGCGCMHAGVAKS